MNERRGNTSKLNCDIEKNLKKRLNMIAALSEKTIWQCVEEAIVPYLEKEEKKYEKII